jgi:hypothetical protein
MMTQSQILCDSLAIAQLELEQYIAQQSNSGAASEGGNYEVQNTIRAFLSSTDDPNAPELSETNPQTIPCREPLRHLLIGTPKAMISTIHYLKVVGYAEVSDWSRPQPTTNPGEVISILDRIILVQ